MILKRNNIEVQTSDRIEAAICIAAGFRILKAGGLDSRTLHDIDDRELKAMAAQHALTKEGSLADAERIKAIIKPYLEP